MKRRELLKTIGQIADRNGADWHQVREGGEHTVYRMNGVTIAIPRHREIPERTAKAIIRQATDAAEDTP